MSTLTAYSSAIHGAAGRDEAAPNRKGLFQRFIDRLIEARMRQAEEFIRQHSGLIPRQLEEQAGWKISEHSEGSPPFVR
jgi:hypothetical protein